MNNGHPNCVIQLVEIENWKRLVATVYCERPSLSRLSWIRRSITDSYHNFFRVALVLTSSSCNLGINAIIDSEQVPDFIYMKFIAKN
jgi:hypothetical protein